MPSMASVTLIGHLGADPEVLENRVKCRVAVNTRRAGNKVTTWYDVTVWGKQAEFFAERVAHGEALRGALVCVQGEIEARPWTGKDGAQRVSLDVNANRVMVMGSEAGQEPVAASSNGTWSEPPF